jgi:hypothetical protein
VLVVPETEAVPVGLALIDDDVVAEADGDPLSLPVPNSDAEPVEEGEPELEGEDVTDGESLACSRRRRLSSSTAPASL